MLGSLLPYSKFANEDVWIGALPCEGSRTAEWTYGLTTKEVHEALQEHYRTAKKIALRARVLRFFLTKMPQEWYEPSFVATWVALHYLEWQGEAGRSWKYSPSGQLQRTWVRQGEGVEKVTDSA